MMDLIIELYHKPEFHPYFLIVLSILSGGLLGFERQITGHKEAGRRTMSLVSMGSCLFAMLPFITGNIADPWRVAGQVVTGIGFIGGGVLIKENFSVKGLTTAATIWLSAALGICFAADKVTLGIFCTIIGFLILRLKDPFDIFKDDKDSKGAEV